MMLNASIYYIFCAYSFKIRTFINTPNSLIHPWYAGAGVAISVSAFVKDTIVHDVKYCAFSQLRRTVSLGKDNAFTATDFEAFLPEGETGILYSKASS